MNPVLGFHIDVRKEKIDRTAVGSHVQEQVRKRGFDPDCHLFAQLFIAPKVAQGQLPVLGPAIGKGSFPAEPTPEPVHGLRNPF